MKQAEKQAVLPTRWMQPVIGNGEVTGKTYYTVPWALMADQEEKLWLKRGYALHNSNGGTVQMRVELHEDGYHVWPVPGRRYAPGNIALQVLPVAVLEDGKPEQSEEGEGMQVKSEVKYTVELDTAEAGKLTRSLGRVLAALPKIPSEDYSRLQDLGDVDRLFALKVALRNAAPRGGSEA